MIRKIDHQLGGKLAEITTINQMLKVEGGL
jgi:hypothetical protein